VRVDVKFCGLTRPEDAALGASLGAAFLGVVFAPSPRRVDAAAARKVFAQLDGPKRVGVFGTEAPQDIARIADEAGLDVVQLHGDPTSQDVAAVRALFDGEVWAACRIDGDRLPGHIDALVAAADRILVDTHTGPGAALGGSGVQFAWESVAQLLMRLRGQTPLVVAGGLRPDNVGRAIEALSPDVVDVSSGVEAAPGIKDASLMRAFAQAVGATTK